MNGKVWEWQNLKKMSELLPDELFLRIQKSYLVNLHHIKSRKKSELTMSNGDVLPIGNAFRKRVNDVLDRFLAT